MSIDPASVATLADETAKSLAERSMIDVELREALQTSKPSPDTVRIGKHDIVAREVEKQTLYDIRLWKTDVLLVEGLAFYETARIIVGLLADGHCVRAIPVQNYVRSNSEYLRVASDVITYEAKVELYFNKGDETRACLNENRLGEAMSRARFLRVKLFSRAAY